MSPPADVLVPTSAGEAIAAFGDGSGITVVGGATIVMADVNAFRTPVSKALLLSRAQLAGIRREGGTITIGAATALQALVDQVPEPLSTAAQRVGDYEIRGQATIGGNLCAGPARETPRGDLQAPLIALDATVRTAGAGEERTQPVEEFLAAGPDGRLVLEIAFAEPARGVYVSMGRPHAHVYTVLSVACVGSAGGVRVAVGGAGPTGRRAPSVERAVASGASSAEAAAAVLDDVEPEDDALASAWYRRQTLPPLVARALNELGKETA